jgi:uncharacterized protein YbbC (DUF1343 family)
MIIPGIDNFLSAADSYKNTRLAMVSNDAAFTSAGIRSRVALQNAGVNLVKIFSPEHGLHARGADGAFQKNISDNLTGLPVTSLYGHHLAPSEEDLKDIDGVLFDIPDVGCRFYTYLWTMTHVMEACAAFHKPLIILDRPNPISGELKLAEGPMLDENNCSSFIGRWSIPIRHSCTLGELAKYFSVKRIIDLDVRIITAKNWVRHQQAGNENFAFVPTSPAINNVETALLYPGMGLLEGINVNEGRGTDKPFKIFGAPWINAGELLEDFLSKDLPGIAADTISYTPAESLYKQETCHGLQLTVTDPAVLRPVQTGIELLKSIARLYPQFIEERLYTTLVNPSGKGHLDKLIGLPASFEKIRKNEMILTGLSDSWKNEITPFLLYS